MASSSLTGKMNLAMSRVKDLYFDTMETESPFPVLEVSLRNITVVPDGTNPTPEKTWRSNRGEGPNAYLHWTIELQVEISSEPSQKDNAPAILISVLDASRNPEYKIGYAEYTLPVHGPPKALGSLARGESLTLPLLPFPGNSSSSTTTANSDCLGSVLGKITLTLDVPPGKAVPSEANPDVSFEVFPAFTCHEPLVAAVMPRAECVYPECPNEVQQLLQVLPTDQDPIAPLGFYTWLRLSRDSAWRTSIFDAVIQYLNPSAPSNRKAPAGGEASKSLQDVLVKRCKVVRMHQWNTKIRMFAEAFLMRTPFSVACSAEEEWKKKTAWKRHGMLHEDMLWGTVGTLTPELQTVVERCWWGYKLGVDTANPSVEAKMQAGSSFNEQDYTCTMAALIAHLVGVSNWTPAAASAIATEDYPLDQYVAQSNSKDGNMKLFQRVLLRHVTWWCESFTVKETMAFLTSLIPHLIACRKWKEEMASNAKAGNTTGPIGRASSGAPTRRSSKPLAGGK